MAAVTLAERLLSADPTELVRMLYDKAIECVEDARAHLAAWHRATGKPYGVFGTSVDPISGFGDGRDPEGGTLDVTVLQAVEGSFVEQSSMGVQRLGGLDLDGERLVVLPTNGSAGGRHEFLVDVSDLAQAAEDLRDEQRRLRTVQRVAQIGSWEYDPDTGEPKRDDNGRVRKVKNGEPGLLLAQDICRITAGRATADRITACLVDSQRIVHRTSRRGWRMPAGSKLCLRRRCTV